MRSIACRIRELAAESATQLFFASHADVFTSTRWLYDIRTSNKKPYEDKFHGALQDLRVKTLKTRRISRSATREIAGLFRVSWNICCFAQNAEPSICLTSTGETRAVLPYSASRSAPTNGEPVPRTQRA